MPSLFQNILATICYYDCFDFPLTTFEIWKNLINSHQSSTISHQDQEAQASLKEIIKILDEGKLGKYIEEYQGFYFLRGRKNLVSQRIERNKISIAKIKKLRKYIKILRLVPFVRMVAITGRLAMKNAELKSDWDVLIVLEQGRIWIGRMMATLVLHLVGIRRHTNKIRDRICLNHFITSASLEIKLQDLFSSHEYTWIRPIFDTGIFEKFQIRNNWIREYRPNYGLAGLFPLGMVADSQLAKNVRKWLEKILDWEFLEKTLKTWQEKKIAKNPKTGMAGSYIEASDEALIFLPEPRGPKIYECFQNRLELLDEGANKLVE
jgi:hypothetical protein